MYMLHDCFVCSLHLHYSVSLFSKSGHSSDIQSAFQGAKKLLLLNCVCVESLSHKAVAKLTLT